MDGFQRSTRELELPTRLQRDRGALTLQRDQLAALADRLPVEALETRQHFLDARPVRLVRQGRVIGQGKAEFLVLGADTELVLGLFAGGEIGRQLVQIFNGSTFAARIIRAAHAKRPCRSKCPQQIWGCCPVNKGLPVRFTAM